MNAIGAKHQRSVAAKKRRLGRGIALPPAPREADEGQRCDGRKKGSKAVSGPPPRSQSDTSRHWINGGTLPFPLLADW